MSDPYPFEARDSDDEQIRELEIESIDSFGDRRITVGDLVDEHESWRFGHVIVDEAQDLTAMQWRMVMRRVRGRSLTVVGDLAQRTIGKPGAWSDHLPPELDGIDRQDLTINYRSPTEINELVRAVLNDIAPGVAHSQAIRRSGYDPRFIAVDSLDEQLGGVIASIRSETAGQLAVITAEVSDATAGWDGDTGSDGTRWLTPAMAKGLEFDVVVVVEPAAIWALPGGGAHLYVALTRPTQHLIVVHQQPLPSALEHSRHASG